MSYADLSQDDLVLLAIEFVAKQCPMPAQITELLGEELIYEIQNPVGEPNEETDNSEGGA